MGSSPSVIEKQVTAAREQLAEQFPIPSDVKVKEVAGYAPGRVNLIGEHTDYQQGFVFPLAIDRGTVVLLRVRDNVADCPRFRIHSAHLAKNHSFDNELPSEIKEANGPWWSYFVGSLFQFAKHVEDNHPDKKESLKIIESWFAPRPADKEKKEGEEKAEDETPTPTLDCFDAVIISDCPVGRGVSSSAALEVASVIVARSVTGLDIPAEELMLIAQKAEHNWAKVPCGLMDQAIACLGTAGNALQFDCKSNTGKAAPLPTDKVQVLVFDCGTKHALVDGEYKKRREECAEAVKMVNEHHKTTHGFLRDVATSDIITAAASVERDSDVTGWPLWAKRGVHVVEENDRCVKFADALSNNDYKLAGELMNASHNSLKDLFQVTIKELDDLSAVCRECDGCYGARMTGGGFGGSVVALVESGKADAMKEAVATKFTHVDAEKTRETAFLALPSDGGRCLVPFEA